MATSFTLQNDPALPQGYLKVDGSTSATFTTSGITGSSLTDSSVTASKLAAGSVGATQIANGSVIAAKLGTNEQKQICKAWVNFNGTTSPGTIRSQYNVSSVTKNATGDYTVNFATAMTDANYSVSGMSRNNHVGSTDPNSGYGASICISRTTDPTINAVRVWTVGLISTGAAANVVSAQDQTTISIATFGN